MSFPTELPTMAIHQLINTVENSDHDAGRIALAVYDLAGFGLHTAFPTAAYPVGATPAEMVKVHQILDYLKGVNWEALVKYIPEIISLILMMSGQGAPKWRIALAVFTKYHGVLK